MSKYELKQMYRRGEITVKEYFLKLALLAKNNVNPSNPVEIFDGKLPF